jgi:hypothetical protein
VVIDLFFHSSLNADQWIDKEGAIKLSEALKSNTSLTSLNLSCNTLVDLFHSYSTQIIRLVIKGSQIV